MTHIHNFTFKDLPVSVAFCFTPAEPAGINYPGCDEDYEVISVKHAGEYILDFIESSGMLEDLTQALIKDMKNEG